MGHPAVSHSGDSAASGVPSPVTGHMAPGPCGAAHMSIRLSYKAALEAITLLEALRGEANEEGRVREFTSSRPAALGKGGCSCSGERRQSTGGLIPAGSSGGAGCDHIAAS